MGSGHCRPWRGTTAARAPRQPGPEVVSGVRWSWGMGMPAEATPRPITRCDSARGAAHSGGPCTHSSYARVHGPNYAPRGVCGQHHVCVCVCVCVCVQVLPPLLSGFCHLQVQLTIVQTSVTLPSVHSVITVCHTSLLRLASLYCNCCFPLLLRPRCCHYYCLCCIHYPVYLRQILITLLQVDRWSDDGPKHWIQV